MALGCRLEAFGVGGGHPGSRASKGSSVGCLVPAQRRPGPQEGTLGAGSDPLPCAAKSVASSAMAGNEHCCLVLLYFLAAGGSCWFLSHAQRWWHFFQSCICSTGQGDLALFPEVPRITLNQETFLLTGFRHCWKKNLPRQTMIV